MPPGIASVAYRTMGARFRHAGNRRTPAATGSVIARPDSGVNPPPRPRAGISRTGSPYPFHFFSAGPVYTLKGRMSRLFACCSITCAHHPLTRLATKIGVYWGTGIPIV